MPCPTQIKTVFVHFPLMSVELLQGENVGKGTGKHHWLHKKATQH